MAATAADQPSRATLLQTALDVFRTHGYAETTLDEVARQAKVEPRMVRAQFADINALFAALLAAYNPLKDLEAALDSVEGQTADEILRDAMRRLVKVISDNQAFVELAAIDVMTNDGASLVGMGLKLFPRALGLMKRLKDTGQLRPVSDVILARTLVAMLLGFVSSEQAMPKIGRMAMNLFPQRAWVDGMVDLLLYGVLEDNAR